MVYTPCFICRGCIFNASSAGVYFQSLSCLLHGPAKIIMIILASFFFFFHVYLAALGLSCGTWDFFLGECVLSSCGRRAQGLRYLGLVAGHVGS